MSDGTATGQKPRAVKLGTQDPLSYSHLMLALARKGGDEPAALSHDEIQELCLTVKLHYAQMGIS